MDSQKEAFRRHLIQSRESAKNYELKGNYSKALENYESAVRVADKFNDLKGKMKDLNRIGEIHRTLKKNEKALPALKEALRVAKKLKDLSSFQMFLTQIGTIYEEEEYLKKAKKCYETVLKYHNELDLSSERADILLKIGTIYEKQGKARGALEKYNNALDILLKMGIHNSPKAQMLEEKIKRLL
ncbi:MAG: hypothetical protein BAJALOKI1v1_70011 [Promethearchaeota archaeon]|nr:MAG: hypothetical protein BAJALOKI1v1_70011 [Candidatus Lokiarchaeota archaeon]